MAALGAPAADSHMHRRSAAVAEAAAGAARAGDGEIAETHEAADQRSRTMFILDLPMFNKGRAPVYFVQP